MLQLQALRTVHGLRPRGRGSAPALSCFRRLVHDACTGFLIVRTDHLLAAQGDFVVALRRSGLPSRRPPATGLLGHYPDRTLTGESTAACQDTHRDAKFSGPFDALVRSEGVRVIKTPVRVPQANAIAERWVRTVRNECLDHALVFSRRHLEQILRGYVAHFVRPALEVVDGLT